MLKVIGFVAFCVVVAILARKQRKPKPSRKQYRPPEPKQRKTSARDEAERSRREAMKRQEQAEREAERRRTEADREAERRQREAEREAEKQRKEAEQERRQAEQAAQAEMDEVFWQGRLLLLLEQRSDLNSRYLAASDRCETDEEMNRITLIIPQKTVEKNRTERDRLLSSLMKMDAQIHSAQKHLAKAQAILSA